MKNIKNSLRKIKSIAYKEILHIIRDIRTLILSLIIPVFLLIIFGYAIRLDIQNVSLSFFDFKNDYFTRELKETLKNSSVFSKIFNEYDLKEDKFLKNEIKGKIFIPSNLKEIVIIIDGSDPTLFSTLSGYMIRMLGEKENIFDLRYKILFNPELKSEIFIVPGIIAIILVVISAVLVAISISKEYETGSFYTLFTLPLKPYEIIIGKVIPYILIGLTQFTLVLIFGKILFNIPLRGNFLFLYLSTIIYILSGLSIGIIVSTKFKKTQTALQVTWLTTILPSFLLSGFIFPIENIPFLLRILTYFVPARYFLELLRANLLRNSEIFYMLDELFFLILLSFILIFIALKSIKKEILT
ncbi:MAG: ABC transporter permease [candidate division WOR-3 bacterium]